MKEFKFKPILGALPEHGTEWWTEKDWEEHRAYVEKLKKEGKYLTEGEEITFNFKEYEGFSDAPKENSFSNFGILIPKGSTDADV